VLELGHRRIAIVGLGAQEDSSVMVSRWRLEGYERALADYGLGPDDVRFVSVAGSSRENGRMIGRSVLEGSPRPTAVLVMSDEVAAGVLDCAVELGIDVPGELSIVGFDDSSTSTATVPPLTTVHQDHRTKGRLAAQMLLDPAASPRHEQLGTSLVVRGSTAPAPP
jgi:DNA-binding LacI/PurR family transcriptional regulator